MADDEYTSMLLDDLVTHCLEERAKFRAYLEANPLYCLEIFCRALRQEAGDDHWNAFYRSFYSDVRRWVISHPTSKILLAQENVDDFVNDSYSRFFQTSKRKQLEFPTLGAALKFLHRCVNSVMLDAIRSKNHPTFLIEDFDKEHAPDFLQDLLNQLNAADLWKKVRDVITDETELRLARLLWIEGYKPREIPILLPKEFPDMATVRRAVANIVDRLRRRYRRDESES